MTLAAYNGHEALTFPDYLDLGTGRTLHAEPRAEPYDVAPASGRAVPDVPQGWFTPVRFAAGSLAKSAGAPAEGGGAPETGGEEEAGGEPDDDEDSAP